MPSIESALSMQCYNTRTTINNEKTRKLCLKPLISLNCLDNTRLAVRFKCSKDHDNVVYKKDIENNQELHDALIKTCAFVSPDKIVTKIFNENVCHGDLIKLTKKFHICENKNKNENNTIDDNMLQKDIAKQMGDESD